MEQEYSAYANLKLFDFYRSVYYQKTPRMNKDLASTYDEINKNFEKINEKIHKVHPVFDENNPSTLYDIIAQDKDLFFSISKKANVDPEFINYYLSRALTIDIKKTKSKREQYKKIQMRSQMWTDSVKGEILNIAILEDGILAKIYKIRKILTKMISYQVKTTACHIPAYASNSKEKIEEFKRYFPNHSKLLLNNRQNKIYEESFKLDNPQVNNDPEQITKNIEKAQKLSLSPDRKVRIIGYDALYRIYQTISLKNISSLLETLKFNYTEIKNEISKLSQKKGVLAAIMRRLSISLPDLTPQNTSLHIVQHTLSHISQFYADISYTSLAFNLSSMIYLIEEMINTYIDTHAIQCEARSSFVKNIQKSINTKEKERELLNIISEFLDNYESECLVYDKLFNKEGIKSGVAQAFELKPQRSTFFFQKSREYISPLTQDQLLAIEGENNDWRDRCSLDQLLKLSGDNPKIIDYIVQKHFALPATPKKTPCKRKRPQKRKNKKRRQYAQKKSVKNVPNIQQKATIEAPPPKEIVTQHGVPLSKIHYAPRIQRWFKKAFAKQYSFESILYHTFAPYIDVYLLMEGKLEPWAQQNAHCSHNKFSLPGKIIHENGDEYFVIFSCTVNQNNLCYHRGYSYVSQTEIERNFNISADQKLTINLNQSTWKTSGTSNIKEKTTIKDINNKLIYLFDGLNNVNIIIYRINETESSSSTTTI